MPAENKTAIRDKLAECKAALAVKAPASDVASEEGPSELTAEASPSPPPERRASAWWTDPIGGALVGAGVVGLGVGAALLVSASVADDDKLTAATYGEYKVLDDRAESRGRFGVIATAVGGALVLGGIVRYALRGGDEQRAQVSGWIAPEGGGGIAAVGRF
jgi:hypothetical protein